MNICVVTVYQPFTNLGSFLQAFAMQTLLNEMGYNVYFLRTSDHSSDIKHLVCRINPKREFLLRFSKAFWAMKDLSFLNFISVDKARQIADVMVYGSDEIWNVTNKFFQREIFWGNKFEDKKRIGVAISMGHATCQDFSKNISLTAGVKYFNVILSRDSHTQTSLTELFNIHSDRVLDPTLLIDWEKLNKSIKVRASKYILVYTYGIEAPMITVITDFARSRGLKIVSPFFWHSWVDEIVECSALQFSTLIRGAEYVFTTTFHGAIFAMINHSKCAILPLREKVKEIAEILQCQDRLVDSNISIQQFAQTISAPFGISSFEANLKRLRQESLAVIENTLKSFEQ